MRLRKASHHPQSLSAHDRSSSPNSQRKAGASFRRFSVRKRRKTTRLLTLAPSQQSRPSFSKMKLSSVVVPRKTINRDDDDVLFSSVSDQNTGKVTTGTFTSTVGHAIAAPTNEAKKRGIDGLWHVKFPMSVGKLEKLKRKLVAGIMHLRNKPYKSRYFNNPKTLAEREVLAGKMAQLVSLRGPSYVSEDWQLNRTPQIEVLHNSGQHCVANRHIYSKYPATLEHGRDIVYDGEHNPASVYVVRRFFLGDEDAVKRDNYLVDVNGDGVHCFIPVDYGFSFYNHSDATDTMDFKQFVQWTLHLPGMHRLHYAFLKRGESIMDLIHTMSPQDQHRAVYMALSKIASIQPHEPHIYSQQISDPLERQRIYDQLQKKITTAKRLVEEARHHPDIQPLL